MKKVATLLTAGLFTVLSASAFACPKGTQLQGGTGPNHKGGKCVASHTVKAKKETTQAKKTVKKETMKAASDTKKAASTTTQQVKQEAAKSVKTS